LNGDDRMSNDDDELWRHYAGDGADALRAIEESLLELEQRPDDVNEINRLYRGLHTLKGNSAFVGLRSIEGLAHAAEDMIGLARDGGVSLDAEMIELALQVVDCLRQAVETAGRERRDGDNVTIAPLTDRVAAVTARRSREAPVTGRPASASPRGDNSGDPGGLENVDPAMDVGFLEVFLSLGAESLAAINGAMADLLTPERATAAREKLRAVGEDLGLASERMGYVHLTDLAARMTAACAAAGNGDWSGIELALGEALAMVEAQYRTLAVNPQDFGIGALHRRSCANVALADLARLDGIMSEGAPVQDAELRSLFARLRVASDYYEFPAAVAVCGELEGPLRGALAGGVPPAAALVARAHDLVEQLGKTIHAVNAGLERPGSVLVEASDDPMKFTAPADGLPLSPDLRRQLTRTGLGALSQALERGKTILEIEGAFEQAPALGEAFMRWVCETNATLVTSAVVGPPPSANLFLIITSALPSEVACAFAVIDPGGQHLIAHPLKVGGASRGERASEPGGTDPDAKTGKDEAKDTRDNKDVGAGEGGAAEFLRIDGRRVSVIMDLAGEIGLASSAVTRHPELEGKELEGFSAAAHKLEMLIRELQNEVSAMRLVPVAGVFQRMRRVVRDTARRTGKKVDLMMVGEETEIDKLMADSLHDPLVHVLRNAIDHGIESPEERSSLGKTVTGTIVLEASHQGGEVTVQVSDDGRGVDRARVLARARERGLIDPSATLSDDQVSNLIFLPGFSTKETIDELSGRGVGMDVVKTTIEQLRGRVVLRSTPGRGTSLIMNVPLTLAFVEAMVVGEGERLYAVPIEKVFEVFRADPTQIAHSSVDGQTVVRVRDQVVPVLWLHRYYGEQRRDEDLAGRIVVVVQTSAGRRALPVDTLRGNQQVMLKPLKGALAGIRGGAGFGMLRSGDVALALDCEQLLRAS
jgi:two-component system chemotaxis sensor kinase CheA